MKDRWHGIWLLATLVSLGVLQCCFAEPARTAATKETSGTLKVGDSAPEFTLKDQKGKERNLKPLLKKGNVALVFYRSVRW